MNTRTALLTALTLTACAPNIQDTGDVVVTDSGDSEGDTDASPLPGYPTLTGPCVLGTAQPRRLVVTTTDFATGAVSVIDAATDAVSADVALGSTDALPFAHGGYVYLLHRYTLDALDTLDADGAWATLSQQAIEAPDVSSANAHRLAFSDDGRAYMTLFGAPEIHVYALDDPTRPTLLPDATIDISAVADADGNPEASLAVVCGELLLVSIGRLDEDALYQPTTDHDAIVLIDRHTGALHDLDADADGVQPLRLQGRWARQWRLDPADADRQTLLVLTTGLERLDVRTGAVSWAITPERLAAVGVADVMQPQAFALAEDGQLAYLAAYTANFGGVSLFAGALDDDAPLVPIATGLRSVERVLERVGDTLWYGDRADNQIGVHALDLTTSPPTPRLHLPLDVGLPPYSMIAIP